VKLVAGICGNDVVWCWWKMVAPSEVPQVVVKRQAPSEKQQVAMVPAPSEVQWLVESLAPSEVRRGWVPQEEEKAQLDLEG
tara:strand:+ start:64 stop:306 length:243 start_codon:yes stop_codon:yes gene_type:complete